MGASGIRGRRPGKRVTAAVQRCARGGCSGLGNPALAKKGQRVPFKKLKRLYVFEVFFFLQALVYPGLRLPRTWSRECLRGVFS